MTPLHAAAGAVVVAAFLGGAWVGRSSVKADWAAEREQQAHAQAEYLSRNYVSRTVAEAQYQALAGQSAKVLQEVTRVPAKPLQCQPGADVRSVVLPGLADKLRKLRSATGVDSGADVGPVQP